MHKHSKIYDADSYAVTLGKGRAQISEPDLFYILLNFVLYYTYFCGHPLWLRGKEPTCQCRRFWFSHWVRKISWRREWQPAPISLPGKAHGQRKLTGPSAWNRKRFRHNLRLKTYLFLYLKLDLNPPTFIQIIINFCCCCSCHKSLVLPNISNLVQSVKHSKL